MLNNVNINVEHIIAKIDNDFNPDTSDWIPRVSAWVIDAMGQVNALRKIRKEIKLTVRDRIAYSMCDINSPDLIVKDSNGCIINNEASKDDCSCDSSTGKILRSVHITPSTVDLIENEQATSGPNMIAETVNTNSNIDRYNYGYAKSNVNKSYILIDNNKLELNFDANCVYVTTETVETKYSDTYECDIPVIPNVPILIEAIGFYCMWKMLLRGYKHPVLNLSASQYGTNPYYEWKQLKDQAKRSIIINAQGDINVTDGNLFQSSFFITMNK